MNLSDAGDFRPATDRIGSLDALRGVAVLGILVINIIGFSTPQIAFSNPLAAGGSGALNHGLWTLTTIYVEGTMRGLFTLLVGAGVVLFTARRRSRRPDSRCRPLLPAHAVAGCAKGCSGARRLESHNGHSANLA